LEERRDHYALVVTFVTEGQATGTNQAAASRLDALIREVSPPLARTVARRGIEGERDVCFKLDELSAEKREELIARVRRELGSAPRVTIRTNVVCRRLL